MKGCSPEYLTGVGSLSYYCGGKCELKRSKAGVAEKMLQGKIYLSLP